MKIQLCKHKNYQTLLCSLKERVQKAQIKASLSINAQLIELYWQIGREILLQQFQKGWGQKIIEQLSLDLSKEFKDMKGFSSRNLKYMRKFALLFQEHSIVQQVAAQIPWGHNLVLMDKIKGVKRYIWYAKETINNSWSRNVLVNQIESDLYKRQGISKKLSTFQSTMPKPYSDLAQETMKDPYIFDFLSIGKDAHEREIEKELTAHIQKFLLELGTGFAFVGNQYHLEVDKEDYYLDLLFYHLTLRCYVVIELKAGTFKPEDVGKLNFYLSAVDDILKHKNDNPSIGMILCKNKGGKIKGEYSLKNMNKPIGLSEYRIVGSIPKKLKTKLPTIEELERELS